MPAMQMVGHRYIMLAPRYEYLLLLPIHYPAIFQGYLDIVKWLCEKGGVADIVPSSEEAGLPVTGINRKSVGGWTPLS
jgi:hypothetical protein